MFDAVANLVGTVVVLVVIAAGWRLVRQNFINVAAAARESDEEEGGAREGYGRVYPSGPPRDADSGAPDSLADGPIGTRSSGLARWWFRLEGWQQTSIVGALAGVIAAIAVQRYADQDGFELRDLPRAVFVWLSVLWFSLTVWTRAYMARRYPELTSWGARANPIGCLGVFGAFEILPEAVWFLVTLSGSAVTWPVRVALRR